MKFKAFILFCCYCFAGCSTSDSVSHLHHTIAIIDGRDDDLAPLVRQPVYRIRLPRGWTYQSPLPAQSLVDTTLTLGEFFIREDGEEVRITIHNFPTDNLEDRIPIQAQLQRWKKQFDTIVPSSLSTTPQAFSGYSGLLLELTGTINGQPKALLGWSLQIAPEHYRQLSRAAPANLWLYQKQMRADITIKAMGAPVLMQRNRQAIIAFARSFELIQDIPSSL